MADISSDKLGLGFLHNTQLLKEIAIDYTPEACSHCRQSDEISLTFDDRGGSRWRSALRYRHGTFGALIECPKGDSSGLNFNIYLSSLEGDSHQDEIDFEFVGKDKNIVQTNYHVNGAGSNEAVHELGFDCSDGFHEYTIKWFPDAIEWLIDGKSVRKVERKPGCAFPEKPMFLYASIWNGSHIADGMWTGTYVGCDKPYVCRYRNVHVPVETAVKE